MAFYFVLATSACLIVLLLGQPKLREYRHSRVVSHPFPEHWRKILHRRVPLYFRMPADLQLKLKKRVQIFIAENAFIGCGGLQVTDEMRVVIAAQACLLTLNRSSYHFPNLRQILIYPGAFIAQRSLTDGSGVQQEQRHVLSGESWVQGQVILSWEDALEGAAVADDGRNVVLHEFAHQLDQENGSPQGAPPPEAGNASYDPQRWKHVFSSAYTELQDQVQQGIQGLFNHYGAQSPAEFFAVSTEVFFEQPGSLIALYPALYKELEGFYKVDPVHWN